MRISITVCACLIAVFFSFGCSSKERLPDGMPPLSPCSIKVVYNDGAPVAHATVVLVPEDAALQRWNTAGVTDANGVASMTTQGNHAGAPAGKFKAYVMKNETEDKRPPAPPEGTQAHLDWAADYSKVKTYSLIEKKYTGAATTTLEVQVLEQPENALELNVGKAVREILR